MAGDYGRRLMPSCLRQEAIYHPQRLFAIAAKSNNVEDGFHHVTFQQVASAVNFMSSWLLDRFTDGEQPSGHPTLAYIGLPDLRYNILFYAAIQCRFKVFLPSPRNPVSVNVSLLQQTACSSLVYTSELAPVSKGLNSALASLQCEQIPSLEELLSVPHKDYIYDLAYADVYQEPILILHSSGSTGLPKPVVHTHGTLATYDVRDFPTVPGRINHDGLSTLRFSKPGTRLYDVFPPFHIAGFMVKIMVPVYNLSVPIFGPPARPPSGVLAAQILSLYEPRCAVLPPSVVEQLFHESTNMELLRKLDVLLYAGGPLPTVIGNELSKSVTLCQFYGSTEAGQVHQLVPQPEDWAYIEFHPSESCELRDAGDGLSELVLFSSKEIERTSSLYHNYPNIVEWHTRDLFEPHPNKPGLWKFHARNDDILVFSSGEKVNPIPMEVSLTAIPNVTGALMVGQGYPQSAILLELGPDARFGADIQKELWPAIEAANTLLPGHGRVSRNMIIIAKPEKPFNRAGKGTVVRALTEKLYALEIRDLYGSTSMRTKPLPITLRPSVFHIRDIKSMLRSVLEHVSIPQEIRDNEDFYTQGMDSIKTAEALTYLRTTLLPLRPEQDYGWLTLETLYLNATIDQLSNLLLSFLNEGKQPAKRNRIAEMQAKIDKYSSILPSDAQPRTRAQEDRCNVAITGTTGYLGRQILVQMVKNPLIRRIYCLNRSSTARENFEKLCVTHNMDIVFLKVNFSLPKLGLEDRDYTQLAENCDVIVHNAWRVDFNLALDSFEDNLQSVSHLVGLSVISPLRPRILFISSISSTGVWSSKGSVQQTVPESIVDDLNTTMKIGYAESKRVAEHLLNAAALQSNVPVTVLRLGQLAPGSDAVWPEKDILPAFLRTCKSSGLLASDFVEKIDWVPVDQAAEIVNDMVGHELNAVDELVRVFNLVNPQEQHWTSVLPTVQAWCGQNTSIMSMQEWVQKLRKIEGPDTMVLETFPALRMLPIYEIIANHGPIHKYDMQNLVALNGCMRRLTKLDGEQLQCWLQQL